MPTLFDPIDLGAIKAPNRILMAPLTRARATRDHVPVPIMADYYAQRASAGLIISEATAVSRRAMGWPYAPGIWTREQVTAWRPITDAVHAAGGRIICQIWHMGRLVHPSFVEGARPLSSSATTAAGECHTYEGKQPYAEAEPLDTQGIADVIEEHRIAALNAMEAGFDGIQMHGASGYLIDQFLRGNANRRADGYGGSEENRIRFLAELTAAISDAIGSDRVSVRLSPNGEIQGVNDDSPYTLFRKTAAMLSELQIAFLEIIEPSFERESEGDILAANMKNKLLPVPVAPVIRDAFRGPLVLNYDYDLAAAQQALASGEADAIAFGRAFIGNPDLPHRLRGGFPLVRDDVATWYTQDERGYTDYPAYPAA